MRYAIVENGKIANVAVADSSFAQAQGWIECPAGADIGWLIDEHGNASPPPPDLEGMAKQVRLARDILLTQTDWTQAADVPQATKDKWAPYRQALRDVPQQPGFPQSVQWPEMPA